MPSQFLLDTNAYYILFDPSCPSSYAALTAKLNYSGVVSFYISEITSMEIHSVLGKYRRKSDPQVQTCKRDIIDGNSHIQCSKTWRDPGRRRLSPNAYCTILAMLKDCEAGKGDIQATTIKVDSFCVKHAQYLLEEYSGRFNFGSHDALIAGSLIAARQQGLDLELVTSDKGLKAVLKEEKISYFDPSDPVEW